MHRPPLAGCIMAAPFKIAKSDQPAGRERPAQVVGENDRTMPWRDQAEAYVAELLRLPAAQREGYCRA